MLPGPSDVCVMFAVLARDTRLIMCVGDTFYPYSFSQPDNRPQYEDHESVGMGTSMPMLYNLYPQSGMVLVPSQDPSAYLGFHGNHLLAASQGHFEPAFYQPNGFTLAPAGGYEVSDFGGASRQCGDVIFSHASPSHLTMNISPGSPEVSYRTSLLRFVVVQSARHLGIDMMSLRTNFQVNTHRQSN
jgi:hypothetical protein